MATVEYALFTICFLFFAGMIHFLLSAERPGIYPPKKLLRKRAGFLGLGGALLLVIAVLIHFSV
ncbi:hypothetical protein D0469_18690 [Peribacillus saganii]|uniref:Uncharacterized protein n=1 Tax=Peribacillus saganii TaxID=2303992 RepID=A0A372LDR5_9BACI|nr:hypothetical protein D0469_18690 [Peribacillus saganii]